jgi:hypothetical protein
MDFPIWAALPPANRAAVDSLVRLDHRIAAIKRLREAFPVDSAPGLYEALDVVVSATGSWTGGRAT